MNTSIEALTVGNEIVCYCTRCKMDLGHTIMVMTGALPTRVICRTCKSEHNYKVKKGAKAPAKPRAPREPKGEKAVPVEMEWTKLMNSSTKPLREYATDQAFQNGDRISHSTFGDGVIQKLIFPNKIEVVFRTDIKMLIHAGRVL